MAISSSSSSHYPSPLDDLYCQEEQQHTEMGSGGGGLSLLPILLLDHDLFSQDTDLLTLFSKEQQISASLPDLLISPRREAVEWMLKVNSFYGFSILTATLSINYLDRFLSTNPLLHPHNQPWTIQLTAVACLSLAAKVEETHVPLLLDLQVAGAEYMFEPRSIQKMELLILSTLDWKMHSVTPVSFLDHIIRRLGLKSHLQFEFLRRAEQLLLSTMADSWVVCYLPSVLSTAIMLHVIDRIEPLNSLDYHDQLISVLNVNKEDVMSCYELILEKVLKGLSNKRNRGIIDDEIPSSPNGVIESCYLSSDGSSESWARGSSASSSVSSSPDRRAMKRNKRVNEQCMPLRVFVNAVVGGNID